MPVLSSSPIPSSNGQHAVDAEQELLPPASAFSATPAASSPTYRCHAPATLLLLLDSLSVICVRSMQTAVAW